MMFALGFVLSLVSVFLILGLVSAHREKTTVRYADYCSDKLTYMHGIMSHTFISFQKWKNIRKEDIEISFFFDQVLKMPLKIVGGPNNVRRSFIETGIFELEKMDFPIRICLEIHGPSRHTSMRWADALLKYVESTDKSWRMTVECKPHPFWVPVTLVSKTYFVFGDVEKFQDDMIKLRLSI